LHPHHRPLTANQTLATLLTLTCLLYFAAKLATLSSGLVRTLLLSALAALTLVQTVAGAVAAYSWAALSQTTDIYQVALSSALGWELLLQVAGQLAASGLVAGALLAEAQGARWAVRSEGAVEVAVRLGGETNVATAVVLAVELGVRLAFASSGAALAFSFVVPKVFLACLLSSISREPACASSFFSFLKKNGAWRLTNRNSFRRAGRAVTLSGLANRSSSLTDFMKSTPAPSAGGLFGRSRKNKGAPEASALTLAAIGGPVPFDSGDQDDENSRWLRRVSPRNWFLVLPAATRLA